MVHAKALEIRWHDQMPIFSADFHAISPEAHRKIAHPYAKAASAAAAASDDSPAPKPDDEKLWRLATAGGDKLVRMWLVHPRPPPPPAPLVLVPSTSAVPAAPPPAAPAFDGSPRVEYLTTLKQHTGVVNVVRFCPVGETLASAGDDGNVLFWVPGESTTTFGESHEDRAYDKESWRVKSMVRTKSGQEIYDIAWSPDGKHILAGSVDQTANIYEAATGQLIHTIAEHTNYVQGVAWDPINHFIATQSSDRSMHVYSIAMSNSGLAVHPVGRNSRMELQQITAANSSWRPPTPAQDDKSDKESSSGKGKDKDVEHRLHPRPDFTRSFSQRSDSDRSEASSTPASSRFPIGDPLPSPSTTSHTLDEPTSMDPPPRPSSRRSSTSSSHPHLSHSPSLIPQSSSRSHFRSPSPAPLPAVRAPSSPKLGSAIAPGKSESIKLYGDASSTPFFRRLCWSTDGSLLLTPAGLFEDPYASIAKLQAESEVATKKAASGKGKSGKEKEKEKEKEAASTSPKPTVYIYSRSNVSRPPIAHLPGHKTTSIAIRFCPVLWELRKKAGNGGEGDDGDGEDCLQIELGPKGVDVELPGSTEGDEKMPSAEEEGEKPISLFDLPYRMVYAVATLDSVFLYDTQQAGPICMFSNLHYAPFTDLTWSSDGQTLVVSSQDGYCSVIAFDPFELGTPYTKSPLPPPPVPSSHPTPTLSASAAPPALTGTNPNTLTAHFAKAPVSAPAPAPASANPTATASSSSSTSAADESGKRSGEGGQEEPVKKKKKVALTFVGPLGS
ncbi:hypothetical protein MNV49_007647 [Pseudohyphozyma bogoriensis]|nr:hypothetical protein MNV49_007647 [Pseudohyphozyma bogoriensis]